MKPAAREERHPLISRKPRAHMALFASNLSGGHAHRWVRGSVPLVLAVLCSTVNCADIARAGCPSADPGYEFCGLCSSPSNCFYCPSGKCPGDPCVGKCTPAAAATGGGGGGTTGSCLTANNCSGAAICVSTRSCVVSAMGNGCDCAGTTAGTCHDYSGTSAARQPCGLEGAACGVNNKPLCCQGNSCNNGRCEGPGGRCPFNMRQ